MTKKDTLIRVRSILSENMNDHGEAIIVTANRDGLPHASWMGTLSGPDIKTILTITSPDSRKIINILENPKVEWMFTTRDMNEVVYLRGVARVVHELDEIERTWKKLRNKSRAYFMRYMTEPGIKFLIVESRIEEIEYNIPQENFHKAIRPPFR